MVRQILTRWTIPNGSSDIITVMNFADAPNVADQRAALDAFWSNISGVCASPVTWTIDQSGQEYDTATGELVGAWVDPEPYTGNGLSGGGIVAANATSVLLQWQTGTITKRKRVRGRNFVPGVGTSVITGGELDPQNKEDCEAFQVILIGASVGLGIWSRPSGSTPGSLAPVQAGTTWKELAVQRRRRG